MSFSTVINLGTVSAAITQVKLYECTGNNTGCTGLTGYSAVNVSTFPSSGITVSGIDDNSNYIKVEYSVFMSDKKSVSCYMENISCHIDSDNLVTYIRDYKLNSLEI